MISKINEPTNWCSGMVVVPKQNEKVKQDMCGLNQYVKREQHIYHVMGQVGDAKIFSNSMQELSL